MFLPGGEFNWCRDFADISRTCSTPVGTPRHLSNARSTDLLAISGSDEVCRTNQMVTRVTAWSYILVGALFAGASPERDRRPLASSWTWWILSLSSPCRGLNSDGPSRVYSYSSGQMLLSSKPAQMSSPAW